MQNQEESNQTIDPEYIAKLLKYYLQFKNPYLKFIVPFKRVSARSMYLKYKKLFDIMSCISNKYKIDLSRYVKFFIEQLNKREQDIKEDFANMSTISQYCDQLKKSEKQKQIYKYFMKSVKNIAEESIHVGYSSTKDFLRYLIANKKLAEYYVTGKISLYFFAAIPNFKKIIPKLDVFARNEFQKLYDRFEMYNGEITAAYMKITNLKVNPLKIVDDLIFKLKQSKNV